MDQVRSRLMAKTATLLSLPFDIEFLTHVLMWRRAEKLRSHDAVLTGTATAILPNDATREKLRRNDQ